MNPHNLTPKYILASALLTTGLLGTVPAIAEDALPTESLISAQEQKSLRIDLQLHNQQFQCPKTGFILHFLPNSKALFMLPDSDKILKADYTVHFNRDIAMNVYENPSKSFDLMMHNIKIHPDGFVARINRTHRYFEKV